MKDTHGYRGANIHSDHFLVIAKLATPKIWSKNTVRKQEKEETFKVHLLKEKSTLSIYRERLNKYLDQRPISKNINLEWTN